MKNHLAQKSITFGISVKHLILIILLIIGAILSVQGVEHSGLSSYFSSPNSDFLDTKHPVPVSSINLQTSLSNGIFKSPSLDNVIGKQFDNTLGTNGDNSSRLIIFYLNHLGFDYYDGFTGNKHNLHNYTFAGNDHRATTNYWLHFPKARSSQSQSDIFYIFNDKKHELSLIDDLPDGKVRGIKYRLSSVKAYYMDGIYNNKSYTFTPISIWKNHTKMHFYKASNRFVKHNKFTMFSDGHVI